jgi:CMP-N,N'-diacetyllegionaminic acid synthase
MSRIIALIPARSGSKGFPDKNIAELNGITLLEHAVQVGKKSKLIQDVYISTDSSKYEGIASESGAISLGLRPDSLSSDKALTIDVIKHFIQIAGLKDSDILVLLQPTSPVRTAKQIDLAIEKNITYDESVTTVAIVDEPNPYKLKILSKNGSLENLFEGSFSEKPRQILPTVYQLTGAIYVSTISNILTKNSLYSENTIPLIVKDFANIDSLDDFEFLKYRCANGLKWS